MSRLSTDRVRLETRVGPRKVTIPALGHGRLAVERESLSPVGQKSWGSRAPSPLLTSHKAGGLRMVSVCKTEIGIVYKYVLYSM